VKRIVASLDAWQRRHPVGGFPMAVLKKFGEDRRSSLAALIAFYALYSLFRCCWRSFRSSGSRSRGIRRCAMTFSTLRLAGSR
jgi:uncharacterized BrkB/YihY/UPF0761 family membrane protein